MGDDYDGREAAVLSETYDPKDCPHCRTWQEHRQHCHELAGGVGDIDDLELDEEAP